jgi:hypothetical protein
LDLLRPGNPRRHPGWKRTRHEFVLECGWWYEPSLLPEGVESAPAGECFKNAFELALDDDSLIYREGVVLETEASLPVHHAWVTGGTGQAIENTLKAPAKAYAGAPFLTGFVNLYHLRSEAVIGLLDDYLHDWPMLGELGDRPREWLDPKGRGVAPLSVEQAWRKQ